MISNEVICDNLEMTSKLMELHNENPFKIKSLAAAAFRLSKMHLSFHGKSKEELESIEGVGKGIAGKIYEILETGTTRELEKLKEKTPEGLLDVLDVKGLGPKKVALLWKELGIESLGELLYACKENRLISLKGFGIKTQNELIKSIEFKLASRDKMHYASAEGLLDYYLPELKQKFPEALIQPTGEYHRGNEVIDDLQLLVDDENENQIKEALYEQNTLIKVIGCERKYFYYELVKTSSNIKHLELIHFETLNKKTQSSEEEVYKDLNQSYVPPELREGTNELNFVDSAAYTKWIEMKHLKGCLHNHSTYSDGLNSLKDMAQHCKDLGYEYFGICDHSQTAVYANGLKPDQVLIQHEEIDRLNKTMTPFKIFKGIESDILSDGKLDYEDSLLKQFDFVVASIHQGFKMSEDVATSRIITAVENPYTTILGHMTGRLLLSRPGYPVNHKKIIDACAANKVAIELNAHPYRLDIDWRWIPYCMEKGVYISINPDAHAVNGIQDMRYGVIAARKGMLTHDYCLNALSLESFEKHLAKKRN